MYDGCASGEVAILVRKRVPVEEDIEDDISGTEVLGVTNNSFYPLSEWVRVVDTVTRATDIVRNLVSNEPQAMVTMVGQFVKVMGVTSPEETALLFELSRQICPRKKNDKNEKKMSCRKARHIKKKIEKRRIEAETRRPTGGIKYFYNALGHITPNVIQSINAL